MTKHFVEYCLLDDPNAPKFKEIEIPSLESSNLPEDTCGYRFYNQDEITIGGKSFLGPKKYVSPMTFSSGEKHSLEEIKESFEELTNLISKMEENDWNRVLKSKDDDWQELEESDYDFIANIQAIPYACIYDDNVCSGISYTLEELEELVNKYSRLISSMETKGLNSAIRFQNGKWRILEEGDKIN